MLSPYEENASYHILFFTSQGLLYTVIALQPTPTVVFSAYLRRLHDCIEGLFCIIIMSSLSYPPVAFLPLRSEHF